MSPERHPPRLPPFTTRHQRAQGTPQRVPTRPPTRSAVVDAIADYYDDDEYDEDDEDASFTDLIMGGLLGGVWDYVSGARRPNSAPLLPVAQHSLGRASSVVQGAQTFVPRSSCACRVHAACGLKSCARSAF